MSKVGSTFMKQTYYTALPPSDQDEGLPQPPLELPYDDSAVLVDLPDPSDLALAPLDLPALIAERRSHRQYAEDPLTLGELADLLWATQGVLADRGVRTLRTVPSAGARHAFETYLLVNRVEGLAPGLYRYIALSHKLLPVADRPDLPDELQQACLDQGMVTASAVTFIWTAVTYRMVWRYGQRGYRYLHLDAGHACQNLYLAAGSIGCGVCALAAFNDERLNDVLGIDGEEQFAIYVATLGKKTR